MDSRDVYMVAWRLLKDKLARSRRQRWSRNELLQLRLECIEEAVGYGEQEQEK